MMRESGTATHVTSRRQILNSFLIRKKERKKGKERKGKKRETEGERERRTTAVKLTQKQNILIEEKKNKHKKKKKKKKKRRVGLPFTFVGSNLWTTCHVLILRSSSLRVAPFTKGVHISQFQLGHRFVSRSFTSMQIYCDRAPLISKCRIHWCRSISIMTTFLDCKWFGIDTLVHLPFSVFLSFFFPFFFLFSFQFPKLSSHFFLPAPPPRLRQDSLMQFSGFLRCHKLEVGRGACLRRSRWLGRRCGTFGSRRRDRRSIRRRLYRRRWTMCQACCRAGSWEVAEVLPPPGSPLRQTPPANLQSSWFTHSRPDQHVNITGCCCCCYYYHPTQQPRHTLTHSHTHTQRGTDTPLSPVFRNICMQTSMNKLTLWKSYYWIEKLVMNLQSNVEPWMTIDEIKAELRRVATGHGPRI